MALSRSTTTRLAYTETRSPGVSTFSGSISSSSGFSTLGSDKRECSVGHVASPSFNGNHRLYVSTLHFVSDITFLGTMTATLGVVFQIRLR
jgi:hypothetical protein